MRYHNITKEDMLNGDGLRTVLWLAGCSHACPGYMTVVVSLCVEIPQKERKYEYKIRF